MSEKIIGGSSYPIKTEKIIGGEGVHSSNNRVTNIESPHTLIGTLKERIALSTKSGGLERVPQNFEDKKEEGGDWVTVNSEDCFEVLYLDFRQHEKITPEIVHKNYEVITNFWKEKNKGFLGAIEKD
ncbi:MAG: hypothetical protein IPK03_05510 [Bacteroidetes bacterium]|nr:hypothetical protein [Bacteroidota bacterium]